MLRKAAESAAHVCEAGRPLEAGSLSRARAGFLLQIEDLEKEPGIRISPRRASGPGRSIVAVGTGRALRSFRFLANIGVLRAGRAQPLYLLTPPGRFGPSAQVSRLLNHSRFPNGCAHGFAAPLRVALGRWPKCPGCSIIRASLTVALMVSLPRFGSLWAVGPSAHRAHASLRATGHTLPSGASEPPKRVVPPQKWWPSVVAGTSRSSSVTAPPASKCGCGVCPAPQARAKRAPRATRATPAQAFRASLRRKKRGLPLQQAHRAIAPFALPPRQALPRLPLKRRARHTAPRARKRFECPKDTRNASRRTLPLRHPGAIRPAPPVRGLESRSSPKYIPNPATCAVDSAALRKQGLLTPLPAREPSEGGREGSGATPGGKDRRQPSFFAERKLPRFRKFVHPQPPPDRELDHRRDGRGIQHAHQRPAEMPPVEGHAA